MLVQGRVGMLQPRRMDSRLCTPATRPLRARCLRGTTRVRAMIREWPDPDFIAEVKSEFPEKMVASVEEARVGCLHAASFSSILINTYVQVLFSEDGYVYLDVRPELELEEVGRVKDAVNIPLYNSRRVYDAQEGKKVIQKNENPDFIRMVERKFPDKNTKLLVACSDGTAYSLDALEV